VNPYRGHMPQPEPIALRVAGHLVRADSPEEFMVKLRRLGEELNFTVIGDGHALITITFKHGEPVTISAEEPCPPN
jgi:hypothetical protein